MQDIEFKENKTQIFENVQQAFDALAQVGYADLKSNQTSQEDAVKLCKDVMRIVLNCRNLVFSDTERNEFQNKLIDLGCTTFAEAAKNFKEDCPETVESTLHMKDNLVFPLSVFTNLIDCGKDSFEYGLKIFTAEDQSRSSWIAQWLDAQEKEFALEK